MKLFIKNDKFKNKILYNMFCINIWVLIFDIDFAFKPSMSVQFSLKF